MKKAYSRKFVLEAIEFWEKQLKQLDESKIGDFFSKMLSTKKSRAAQAELKKRQNYKQHPLAEVVDKMLDDPSNGGRYLLMCVRASDSGIELPLDATDTRDCIAVSLNRAGSDRYDKMSDHEYAVMRLAKRCGLPNGFKFYVDSDDEAAVITDLPSWGSQLDKLDEDYYD